MLDNGQQANIYIINSIHQNYLKKNNKQITRYSHSIKIPELWSMALHANPAVQTFTKLLSKMSCENWNISNRKTMRTTPKIVDLSNGLRTANHCTRNHQSRIGARKQIFQSKQCVGFFPRKTNDKKKSGNFLSKIISARTHFWWQNAVSSQQKQRKHELKKNVFFFFFWEKTCDDDD